MNTIFSFNKYIFGFSLLPGKFSIVGKNDLPDSGDCSPSKLSARTPIEREAKFHKPQTAGE